MIRIKSRNIILVTVVIALLLYLLIFPSNKHITINGIELDPNAPVILVADDNEASQHPQELIGTFRKIRTRIRRGSPAKKFLVFSHDHGGGGLVSEALFNIHGDDVFFLYHPLYKLTEGRDTHLNDAVHVEQGDEGVRWLEAVYNCSLKPLLNHLHEPYLFKSRSVYNTYANHCRSLQQGVLNCVERACQERELRAAYTVRLPPTHFTQLLQQSPNSLKVIVVLRDPRAILSSRLRTYQHMGNLQLKGGELCRSLAEGVMQARLTHSRYPGSTMVVHYEHLVLEPRKVLTHLYHFLGLMVTNDHLNYIIRTLKLNHPEELRLQMTKMWQVEMSLQESRAVDRGCYRHYPVLGYLPVPRNLIYTSTLFYPWDDIHPLPNLTLT